MEDQLIFLIASIGLIGLGLYFIFGKKGGQKSGQIMVEAVIVDQVSERDSRDSDHPGQSSTVSTYPVYEYMVKGKIYRTRGTVAITVFSKNKYKVGTKETVRVDPSRPDRIYTSGEKNAMAGMGVILVIFGVLALVMLF